MRAGKSALAVVALLAVGIRSAPAAAQYFAPPADLSSDTLWTNYLRVADVTGDGHLDVVVANTGGFFVTPQPQFFQIFVNGGSGTFTNATAGAPGLFQKAVRQFALGDIEGDGDLDIYVPDAGGAAADKLLVNGGGGQLVDEASTRLPPISSTAGATRFGDLDGDGDIDLIVLDGYASNAPDSGKILLNDGSGKFTLSPNAPPPFSSGGSDPDDVDLADFDRDFDLDVFVNPHEGKSLLWLNDGTGKLSDATANVPPFGSAFHYDPGVCDVDGDGDLDVWVDNVASSYTEMLLINDGSGKFTNETASRVLDNVVGADDNGVACIDVDHDGDFDAAVMSLSANERVLLNDGTGKFGDVDGFPVVSDPTLWFDFGDLNGDGRLDCVTGQGEGQPRINRVYLGASSAVADNRPPKIIATELLASGASATVRFAVSDGVVTDDGPRLERAFVRITAPAPAEVDARFVGGDLFRAVVPDQPAGASVKLVACAIDLRGNEGCGSEQSWDVPAGAGGAGGGAGSGVGGGAGSGVGGSAGGGSGGAAANAGVGGAAGSGGALAGNTGSGNDGGCGCRAPRQKTPKTAWLALAMAVWMLRRREQRA